MNRVCTVSLLSLLLITPIGATKFTQQQRDIYPQNPHLVKEAGDLDPQQREEFINAMQKASSFCHKTAWGCGIAALGCLSMLAYVKSGAAKIGSVGLSIVFAAAAGFLNKVSTVQAHMANGKKLVETEASPDTAPTPIKLTGVADGIYIFCSAHCHACNLLHNALPEMQALPELAIHTFDASNTEAQAIIKRMGITVIGVPLTVVVKNETIACIIYGYSSSNDFVKKIKKD